MTIEGTPQKLVQRLLEASGAEGLEASVNIALDLTHYRWLLAETSEGWTDFKTHHQASDNSASDIFDREIGERLNVESKRGLISAFDSVPSQHPQDESLREFLHHVFEELLALRVRKLGRASNSNSSTEELAELMSLVAGSGARLLDPACGLGTILLRAASAHTRSRIVGLDIDERTAILAEARFELAGISAEFFTVDWLTGIRDGIWDAICLEPPFSLRLSDIQRESNPLAGSKSDMVWLHRAIESLVPSGKAAILLPARTMFSKNDEGDRLQFLNGDLIESIISLPAGMSLGTSIETCLWIVRGSQDPLKSNKTLLINGGKLLSGAPLDRATELAKLAGLAMAWRNDSILSETDSWRAGIVSHDDLRRTGNFSPSAHLSAPPKITEPRPTASVRSLSELRLASFKAVDTQVSVPLRPLTLVYGRNSAGKSSLIQSLLLLRESLNASRMVTRGSGFDLGNFRGLVHRHEVIRTIGIGVSFGSSPALDSIHSVPNPSFTRSVDIRFQQDEIGAASASSATIGLGDDSFLFVRQDEDGRPRFDISTSDLVRLVRLVSTEGFPFPWKQSPRDAPRRVKQVLARIGVDQVPVESAGNVPGRSALIDLGAPNSSIQHGSEGALVGFGLGATSAVAEELGALLARTVYLGPLRQAPQRASARLEATRPETDIPFFLLDNKSERAEVSRWMQRLGMNYDLDVLSLASAPGAHVLGDVASVILTNERAGITLSTADVGFGVSQVLPILVELSVRRESVILIEQPEIHLHPAMQSELADLLIESVDEAGRGNQIIAETHSEHIMLRIQRRIREGQLDPSQVSIIYIDQDADGAAYSQQIRMDDNGDFIDEWPNGFFVERFDEIFSGML